MLEMTKDFIILRRAYVPVEIISQAFPSSAISLYYHSEKLAIAFAPWKTKNEATIIKLLGTLEFAGIIIHG
ncbi:hypothetical protein F8388_005053 [Cannabis sativa]|uniref:Uncharacterized protein n=1 Tax=Cannabis sativa TaxID=3483 RepID=A0A7J6E525_CANSA|nr:hypothetical protein F8388_005053 [Cannabis sativa]